MVSSPLRITLYNPDNEVQGEYTCTCVCWRVLKMAIRLSEELASAAPSGETLYKLAALVSDAFGSQATVAQLQAGARPEEMITVLNCIVARGARNARPPAPPAQAQGKAEEPSTGDWMIDLEISLVRAFGWSLADIDATDIDTLLPFIARLSGGTAASKEKTVYCDQVSWLD